MVTLSDRQESYEVGDFVSRRKITIDSTIENAKLSTSSIEISMTFPNGGMPKASCKLRDLFLEIDIVSHYFYVICMFRTNFK